MDPQRTLYVTYLEKEGPYIKVWGQTVRNLPVSIEEALQRVTPKFEQGHSMPVLAEIHVGQLCCAKFRDNRYYRARVTNISHIEQGLIEVLFLDYGNRDIIPYINIRTPLDAVSLLSLPPQAKDFILAEVAMPVFDIESFEAISSKLRYLELEVVPICEIGPFALIRLLHLKQDVCIELINRGLIVNVPIQSQQQDLQQRLQPTGAIHPQFVPQQPQVMVPIKMASPSPPVAAPTPTLLAYKAIPLENGSEHDVYVSYLCDGPCLFSVQLQKLEGLLKRLMAEINSIDLQPLDENPLPGTVCLAQSTEDQYICRAVVTSMVDGEYKVFYVDFGNSEILPFDKLFQIPFKYVIPKVMATRFALSGLETANVSIEMKCAFKEFVNNKLLRMRVKPAAAKTALPLCDLWDENGMKAIEVIKNSALLSYPEPVALPRGFSQEVKVSYVLSCNKFFVQLKSKETELENLMSTLCEISNDRPRLDDDNIRPGIPCYALYTDGVWYRAQIVSVGNEIKVKYVDYGNEDSVAVENLREPISEHVFMLRPQAIECCLNGYQNVEPDAQRDGLLVDLITEQEFTMKVVEMQTNRALVELFDSAHYNVASLLLDKVASATSQVSPLLIQDNHRIEHRKRSPPQHYKDKRPLRELNERNQESNNWRQNSFQRHKSKPNVDVNKSSSGGFYNHNSNRKPSRNQRDGHESSDSKESYNNSRERHGFNAGGSGTNKNMYKRGPKRFDGPRKRGESSEENGEEAGDEGSNKSNGNRENWGFERKERRFDNNSQHHHSERPHYKPRFDNNSQQHQHHSERPAYKPREGGFQRNNDDHPKRFNNRNADSNRNDDRPRNFNRFDNNNQRNRRDYKKDHDANSSDTSENSFKRSPKPYQSDNRGKGRSFKRSPVSATISSITTIETNDWGLNDQPVIPTTTQVVEEDLTLASPTDQFKPIENLIDQTENVSISWFYNPQNFIVQLEKFKGEFRTMMEEIQVRYKKRSTITPTVGQPVIALFSEDKVLYRAQVLSCEFNIIKVRYVDYGNIAVVDKIYAIETKYLDLPAQGVCCSLNNILPFGENWLNADSYSAYFDKEVFSCHFISNFDTNAYYVDLRSENVDISEGLISSSLAIRPQSDFNVNLLFGQQLMVHLKDVKSLDNLTIEIEPNLGINAMVHNLADATETFEDDLKAWIGSFVFIYVDNVINDKLEVTLYDTTGQKIKVVVPDEGAFETIDVLCPLPIYTNSISGLVCYATTETIFLQPTKFQQTVAQFLDAMFNHYNESTQEEGFVPVLDGIYAVLSSDTSWYRGKVTKINEETQEVDVNFVDYGNSETVKISELRELSLEFYQMHMLAVEIKIEGGDCEKFTDFEVFVEEVNFENDCWVGKIFGEEENKNEGENQQELNVNDQESNQNDQKSNENYQETNENYPKTDENYQKLNENFQETVKNDQELKENDHKSNENIKNEPDQNQDLNNQQEINSETQYLGVDVTLSHSDSPSEFYLQLSNDLDLISALQLELQSQIPNLVNLENPSPGILCAAPFSLDNQWYRAQILDADDDITTVRFVDYGNTDVIDNKTTSIKTLPAEMLTTEFHAKLCSLYVQPNGSEWSSNAIEKYEKFLEEKILRAEIIHQDEKTTYVELYANNENVAEYLKKEGLAIDLQLETETSSTGFISHLNSPSEFWMQLESSVPDLEWVAEQLTNASAFPTLQDLTPGSLCAAIFPEDESWYRARILSNTVAGIEVIFIDYGNSFSCTELRELPEDLVMLSPLALKCSLSKPPGILQWSSKATEKFNEISADGATVFNVNILTTGETSVVQLTIDSEDISYRLLPETQDCRISHFNSLDNFWVQLIENDPKLQQIETNLNSTTILSDIENPELNEIILTTYENCLRRGKILEKTNESFKVLLIDYGNEIITNNFKKLPEGCEVTEALAKKYKLELLPRTKWAEDAEEKFRGLNLEGTIFKLEEVSEGFARLYLNCEDVRITLGTIKCSPLSSNQSTPKKIPLNEITDALNTEINSNEETSHNISKKNDDSFKFVENIAVGICDKAMESSISTKKLGETSDNTLKGLEDENKQIKKDQEIKEVEKIDVKQEEKIENVEQVEKINQLEKVEQPEKIEEIKQSEKNEQEKIEDDKQPKKVEESKEIEKTEEINQSKTENIKQVENIEEKPETLKETEEIKKSESIEESKTDV